ncbi:RidA family protein [Emticicia sp. BO119]|uniref:RidA family protein n=1 Tax=Emticicia sp. BO119 TaxID=2757768 RepID=UPI0015F1015D|nr:RidA family protein [Emticicia sp. BO119]MBA4852613.1 RidA family protein [Emticicia sp. BO119]
MSRINISTGAKWEDIVGYSRAVKVGNLIEVTGTVATDNSGELVGKNDIYIQTKFIILKVEKVLEQLGASLKDVIRTRIFTTDISKWETIGKAHGEFFGSIKPCTTMVEVSSLIEKDYLVEIEFTAVLEGK